MPIVITLTNCCYNAIEIDKYIVRSVPKEYDLGKLASDWGWTDTDEISLNRDGHYPLDSYKSVVVDRKERSPAGVRSFTELAPATSEWL